MMKFNSTVSTASNVINNKMLDLKSYLLTIQFYLMFFSWGYILFFVLLIICYII